jgi:hypothetical protein
MVICQVRERMGAEVELPTDELFPLFRRKSSPSARKFFPSYSWTLIDWPDLESQKNRVSE